MAANPHREVGPERDSSRERILHAAKTLFANRGYENTSTMAIARAAGTSESQIMKYFGNKQGILEAIFEAGWSKLAQAALAAQTATSPAERLYLLIELAIGWIDQDSELKELLLFEGRRIRREGNAVLLTQGFLQFVGMIDDALTHMRASAKLQSDIPVEAVRSAIMGMFEGLLRDQVLARRMGFPAPYGADEIRKLFVRVVPMLIGH